MTSYSLELEILEVVTRGGMRRVTWHLANEDEWVSVTQLPGAELTQRPNGPGVVWRKQVKVRLELGARLMRVESLPDRAPPKDPMDYLWQARRGVVRKVKRDYFRVDNGGKLVRLPDSGT